MQSLIENAHPPMNEEGNYASEGEFASDAKRQAAIESWELMQLVQQGRAEGATPAEVSRGEAAFTEIYDRYYDRIFKMVLRRVNNNYADAENILTDTFLRAFRAANTYSAQGKDLAAWLSTIAANLVLDHFKNAYTRDVSASLDNEEDTRQWADESRLGRPDALAIASLQREELLDAIRELTPDQQRVIVLRYFEERTIQETAELMGKEEGAIKSLAYRAVQALREILAHTDEPSTEPLKLKALFPEPQAEAEESAEIDDSSQDDSPMTVMVYESVFDGYEKSDWEGPSLLAPLQSGEFSHQAYTRAAKYQALPPERLEELAAQIALGHEAKACLDARTPLNSDEYDQLQNHIDLGIQARRVIVAHNLRFAVRVALRYARLGNSDDLIQEANIGLIKAADKFDPYYFWEGETPGQEISAFTTSAHGYIRGHILRHLSVNRRAYNAPGPAEQDDVQLLRRTYEEARRRGYDITYEQAGEWLGFSAANVVQLLGGSATKSIISLNVQQNRREDISDMVIDQSSAFDFWQSEYNFTAEKFWQYISQYLTEREHTVLREYYVHGKSQTLIAAEMSYSRQNITAIMATAQNKIKLLFQQGPEAFKLPGRPKPAEKLPADSARRLFRALGVFASETEDTALLRAWVLRKIHELDVPDDAKKAVIWQYGLESDGKGMTIQEIAARLSCSPRQVGVLKNMVIHPLQVWSKGAVESRTGPRPPVENEKGQERRIRGKGKRKDGARVFFHRIGVPAPHDADPNELRQQLADIFTAAGLSERQREVAELRYGLGTNDGTEMSQHETADKLGLSRGYVSLVDPQVQQLVRLYLGLVAPREEDTD
jgi:RNA polymerase sigma-70 factor (ECF subfamily)